MTYLVAAFRTPQVPSQSLSFPHGKDTRAAGPFAGRCACLLALASLSKRFRFSIADNHVPRRATGHHRPRP
jgi:hypothetical protein